MCSGNVHTFFQHRKQCSYWCFPSSLSLSWYFWRVVHGSCCFLLIQLCSNVYYCLIKRMFFSATVKLWKCSGNIAATYICIYLLSSVVFIRQNDIQLHYNISSRGRILGSNWYQSLKSFPPCYYQSPLLTDPPPPPERQIMSRNLSEIVYSWIRLQGRFLTGRTWIWQ